MSRCTGVWSEVMSGCTGVWSEVISPGGGTLWRKEGGRRAGLLTILVLYCIPTVLFLCMSVLSCMSALCQQKVV